MSAKLIENTTVVISNHAVVFLSELESPKMFKNKAEVLVLGLINCATVVLSPASLILKFRILNLNIKKTFKNLPRFFKIETPYQNFKMPEEGLSKYFTSFPLWANLTPF